MAEMLTKRHPSNARREGQHRLGGQ